MAYNRANGQSTRNGQRKYYLPRIDLEKYNVIIDGRNFYDNSIESNIEKYRELKKVMIEFKYMLGTNSTIYWLLEKSKETILEFYKGTVKVY